MSNEVSFPLQRQPKGQPTLTYEGPDTVYGRGGTQRIKLRSDRLFHGQDGCSETCQMISASSSGRNLGLATFISNGSLTGTFDSSGGDVSLWVFDLTFVTNSVPTVQDRKSARAAGQSTITKDVRLEFRHTCVEHIPRALTPDREASPCEQALVEEKTFTYEASNFIDITIVHRLHQLMDKTQH